MFQSGVRSDPAKIEGMILLKWDSLMLRDTLIVKRQQNDPKQ